MFRLGCRGSHTKEGFDIAALNPVARDVIHGWSSDGQSDEGSRMHRPACIRCSALTLMRGL